MSCGVGRRRGWDPVLLWLWCRLTTTAQIQPLSWESPYAMGEALKRKKKGKKNSESRNDRAPICQGEFLNRIFSG